MAAENGLIKKENLTAVQAREVEFTEMFVENMKKLLEALGVTKPVEQAANTVLKTYEAVGTLNDGDVAEGETIPLSEYKLEERIYKEAKLRKWRKSTSAEAIASKGYDLAVEKTTDKMRSQAQKEIRNDFFDFLADGKGRATGTTLQAALAQAWGQLEVFFEDYDDVSPIYFLNPLDIADYLATANITTQTMFGMTYIENFLGLGSVMTNTKVKKGTVIATAKGNILAAYIPVNGADLGEAFKFTTDETGYIGIHEEPDYNNMTASDTVICGIDFFAEYLDGVIIAGINSTPAATKYTEADLKQMTLAEIKKVAAEKEYTAVASATTKAEAIAAFISAQA